MQDQCEAGGESGELVEHQGKRADGMCDQLHRQRDDDEQCDDARADDGDAQVPDTEKRRARLREP